MYGYVPNVWSNGFHLVCVSEYTLFFVHKDIVLNPYLQCYRPHKPCTLYAFICQLMLYSTRSFVLCLDNDMELSEMPQYIPRWRR